HHLTRHHWKIHHGWITSFLGACTTQAQRPASQEPAAELPARGPVRGVPPHYGNRRAKGLVRPRPWTAFYMNARRMRTDRGTAATVPTLVRYRTCRPCTAATSQAPSRCRRRFESSRARRSSREGARDRCRSGCGRTLASLLRLGGIGCPP